MGFRPKDNSICRVSWHTSPSQCVIIINVRCASVRLLFKSFYCIMAHKSILCLEIVFRIRKGISKHHFNMIVLIIL